MPSPDLLATCPQYCANYCKNWPYYGLQYGKECWCGDHHSDIDKYGTSTACTYECSGDSSQTCGGYNAMNIYTQGQATDFRGFVQHITDCACNRMM